MNASISVVMIGRNDEYEPGWSERLKSVIEYNRVHAQNAGISLQFVFVEWNPPADRPLLAYDLTRGHADTTVVVVPRTIHDEFESGEEMPIVLSVAVNAGLRAATGSHVLVTGGDDFFGTALLKRIARDGLTRGVVYRAERVNIRTDLPWGELTPSAIEDPHRIDSVDTCTEPPYDRPPFTNACGDFLMLDRSTMLGLRGFDETVRKGRLHLDSRFALNAMAVCGEAELLGRIFHLSHARSFVNTPIGGYAGLRINPAREVPYLNAAAWGLGAYSWRRSPDCGRVWLLDPPHQAQRSRPLRVGPITRLRALATTRRLERELSRCQPSRPRTDECEQVMPHDLAAVVSPNYWVGGSVRMVNGGVQVSTPGQPWGYAAYLPAVGPVDTDMWAWVRVSIRVTKGAIGVGLLDGDEILDEEVCGVTDRPEEIWLRLPAGRVCAVLVRNGDATFASEVTINSIVTLATPD